LGVRSERRAFVVTNRTGKRNRAGRVPVPCGSLPRARSQVARQKQRRLLGWRHWFAEGCPTLLPRRAVDVTVLLIGRSGCRAGSVAMRAHRLPVPGPRVAWFERVALSLHFC